MRAAALQPHAPGTTQTSRLRFAPTGAGARWSLLLATVYLAFCWLTRDRTLIPDEIFALVNAEMPWREQLASIRADLVHPPLIYVLERIWIAAFGMSDAAVKALPIAINLAAIGVFPFLAARVTRRWRLTSVLFFAFYLHAFSAPNLVRMYGLSVLLAIVAILAWDHWRSRPTNGTLVAWTLTMTLGVLTHFFGMLLLAAFVLAGWWRGPRRLTFTLAAAIPALLFLVWLAYVYPVYAARGLKDGLGWIEPSLLRATIIVPFHFLTMIPSGSNPVLSDWWAALPGMKYFVLGAIVLNGVLLAVPFVRRNAPPIDWHWLGPLAFFVFVPMVLLAVISLIVGPAFHTRFVLGVVPAYWLWVATLADQGGTLGKLLFGTVILPVVFLGVLLPLRHELSVSPLRDPVAALARERLPNDIVLVDTQVGPQAYWELRRVGPPPPIQFLPVHRNYARFAADLVASGRVWTFCRAECNIAIQRRLEHHVVERHEGRYLTLYRRRDG